VIRDHHCVYYSIALYFIFGTKIPWAPEVCCGAVLYTFLYLFLTLFYYFILFKSVQITILWTATTIGK